jgi:hypothetical protein
MSDITGIIVVIFAIACTILGQRKNTTIATRRQYALMAMASSLLIAVEAARRDQPTVALFFALAAGASLIGVILDYLKPTKPDA